MVRMITSRLVKMLDDKKFSAKISASNSSSPTQILPSIICETASNTSFNCSNLKLSKIPTNLPKSIVQLNLSHNNFRQFDDDAFDECCENVRELDLSSNEISSLTRRHFERMNNLEVLLLSVNKLVTLDADTFSHLTKLQRLDLSRNPVELQGSDSKGFLVSTNIEELNLDYCNITDIPDGTFTNLTQLLNLTLAGNLLDKDIDESSFKPLHNLIKLRITNLSESSTYRLCNVLTAIDTILFDEFNITCLVLSNDGAFEDSIVPNDPVEEPKIDSVISQPVTARKVTAAQTTTASLVQPSPAPTVTESSTSLPQPQVIEISDEAYTNKTKLEPETASMNIDNDTMKFILIGEFNKKS